MDFALDAIHYIIAAIMVGIAGYWVYMIRAMALSFTKTPILTSAADAALGARTTPSTGTETPVSQDIKHGRGPEDAPLL